MVEAETLGQAIQTLVTGRILVTLISYKSMIHMIAKMKEYLRIHTLHLMIVKHDSLYYYQKSSLPPSGMEHFSIFMLNVR
jgi:hypothetical protein